MRPVCPRITRLDPLAGRPRNVSILFDDGAARRVTSARVARALRLAPGIELDESTLEAAELRLAIERGLSLLAARERSVAELTASLAADGYPEPAVSQAIERLVELGVVDDARFAHAYTLSRLRAGDGPELIIARLRSRGVPADLARRTVLTYAPDVLALAMRALRGEHPRDAADRARLFRRLARKGFDAATALRALDLSEQDPTIPCDGAPGAGQITNGS